MQRRIGHIIVLFIKKRKLVDVSLVQISSATIHKASRQDLLFDHDDAAVQPVKNSLLNKLANTFAEEFTKRLAQKTADLFWVGLVILGLVIVAHYGLF